MLPSPLDGYLRDKTQIGAENICKQLGYTGGTRYTAGGGTGPINAGNRRCIGGEKTIFDCPLFAKRTDITGCKHKHDQGMNCTGGGEKIFLKVPTIGFCQGNLHYQDKSGQVKSGQVKLAWVK